MFLSETELNGGTSMLACPLVPTSGDPGNQRSLLLWCSRGTRSMLAAFLRAHFGRTKGAEEQGEGGVVYPAFFILSAYGTSWFNGVL